MSIVADLAQTFFIDKNLVNKSDSAHITSVDLYFNSKPGRGSTSSNLPAPGVTVYILPTRLVGNDNAPNLGISLGRARVEYDTIQVSTSASTATKFTFSIPVTIKTNTMYAVAIKFDGSDTGFTIWRNKASDQLYNSSDVSTATTLGILDGKFYSITNGSVPTPLHDTDLKMAIRVARFSTLSKTYKAVNRNFEFIRFNTNTLTGNFTVGELVFANNGFPAAQTISVNAQSFSITGTGTTFQSTYTAGGYIVLNSGTTNDIKRIKSIASNTSLTLEALPAFTNASAKYVVSPVARVFDYMPEANSLVLVASTAANGSFCFQTSQNVHGISSNASLTISTLWDFPIHALEQQFRSSIPPATYVDISAKVANSLYTTVNTSYDLKYGNKREMNDFASFIFSRSTEVQNPLNLSSGKSAVLDITLTSDNEYASPILSEQHMNLFTFKFDVNNNTANEHKPNGNATAKYISKPITLAQGQDAEDIKVYLTAFKPQNTDIEVYVRLQNSYDPESLDSKNWSYLELLSPGTLLSNASNPNDLVELEFGLPNFPLANAETLSSGDLFPGKFSSANNDNVLTCALSTVNNHATANIQPNDVVRIYNPLTPNNSLVAVVTASNTTTITIDTTLDSTKTNHAGFISSTTTLNVERVTLKNSAFKNYLNSGVVRYFNNSLSAQDTYKTFAFKIVLLSDNVLYRPAVENIRGIALTA